MTIMNSAKTLLQAVLAGLLLLVVGTLRAQETVVIPVGLPVVDLSAMNLTARTTTLTVSQSCRFVNGTIAASSAFAGEKPLVSIAAGVTVVLDATAAIDASQAGGDQCTAAVSIGAEAAFYELGNVTAPDGGEGIAVYLEDDSSVFEHLGGTMKGSLADKDGIYGGFQVEQNDLLALRAIHQALHGDQWTSKQWSFAKNGHRREDFPGVTFTDEGRVTAIDLPGNGLKGTLPALHDPQLTELATLNMSNNQLTGDIGTFVQPMQKLQKLDLSYNGLTEISVALPQTCSSLDLQYQNRQYGNTDYPTDHFHTMAPVIVPVNTQRDIAVSLPSLFTYYASMRRGIYGAKGPSAMLGMLNDSKDGWLRLSWKANIYTCPQDTLVALVQEQGVTRHSAIPIVLHYAEGDADMTGETDVLDVQHTLNYIFAPATIGHFNLSAANTYDSDDIINVQDIVATVNIILEPTPNPSRRERGFKSMSATDDAAEGELFTYDNRLMLRADRPVAALDIELAGVTTEQVSLQLNRRDFQMIGRNTDGGSRYVIFSPTGQSIPAAIASVGSADGATAILRLSAPAQPVAALCADPQAQPVILALGSEATGIDECSGKWTNGREGFYDLLGHRVDGSKAHKGVYIHNGRKVVR